MDVASTCFRHQRIETEAAAKGVAAKLKARSRKYQGVRAYSCKVGGTEHWHVGRTKRR